MNWREFIIRWNNENPLDKQYREKYNIPFNSRQHRELNQFDIFLEYVEDKLFDQSFEQHEENEKKKKQYAKGIWIEDVKLTQEEEDDLFDRIDISAINEQSSTLKFNE